MTAGARSCQPSARVAMHPIPERRRRAGTMLLRTAASRLERGPAVDTRVGLDAFVYGVVLPI